MTDRIEKLERQNQELIGALFQIAHDLQNITDQGTIEGLKRSIQSAGGTLHQSIVALNGGRGPDGRPGLSPTLRS